MADARDTLLEGLTARQREAVGSSARRLLVIAGAGSGKTEVMARRVAWWTAVEGAPRDAVAAFTFTERAAEEMKFRIRRHIGRVTPPGEDATLGRMYVGTIHGFCLRMLRELRPEVYYNFDVLDEAARAALVERGYYGVLGLSGLQKALGGGKYATAELFLEAYDLLNEYGLLEVELPSPAAPVDPAHERDWCAGARLVTDVGSGPVARAFAGCAARYYAYLRCRRFLDFSTSQSELLRLLLRDARAIAELRSRLTHVVVDEAQDLNPVQDALVRLIVGDRGRLTAVGDHRQAIYAWRGARVDLMAALHAELSGAPDGHVVELEENFRSTPRIVDLANRWAATVDPVGRLGNPPMKPGNGRRVDEDPTHVAVAAFASREEEAAWIADRIARLVPGDGAGAFQDTPDGERGISYSDVAVLVRSSTDARTYMAALERRGIPAVFRAGPDLFSQPEVMLFAAAFARAAGVPRFLGSVYDPRSFPARIKAVLGCDAEPEAVVREACGALRAAGLPVEEDLADRLLAAADGIGRKLGLVRGGPTAAPVRLRSEALARWLAEPGPVRRVFPQRLYHLLLEEAGAGAWEAAGPRGRTALFHLGQLSSLIKGMETPGWTDPEDFRHQVMGLCQLTARNARTEEAPLLVPPDAVTIATIHAVKGLEFAAVFLADVCYRRFPSGLARQVKSLPFDGPILERIDPAALADDENYNQERRLMYVALTRAERYLFVTCSAGRYESRFFREVEGLVRAVGGATGDAGAPRGLRHLPAEVRRELRLATSFTDLCYYLRCPRDFYLRKVLGFAPTIDQAFGYGRGVHNLLREVHARASDWARLAADPEALEAGLWELIGRGLFYLRYTTGPPAENMRKRAVEIVGDYVATYADELARLEFEPEREFETLIEEEQVMVSGAVDLVRLDDPPRVTLIDFKSGERGTDAARPDEDEMRLQMALYGLAAKRELQYEPDRGLVRYLGESDPRRRQLEVALDDAALARAGQRVVEVAREIRRRNFDPRPRGGAARCRECDFGGFCGGARPRRRGRA